MKENVSGCFFLNTVYFVSISQVTWRFGGEDRIQNDQDCVAWKDFKQNFISGV